MNSVSYDSLFGDNDFLGFDANFLDSPPDTTTTSDPETPRTIRLKCRENLVHIGVLHRDAGTQSWTIDKSYFRISNKGKQTIALDWVKIKQALSDLDPTVNEKKRTEQYRQSINAIRKKITNRRYSESAEASVQSSSSSEAGPPAPLPQQPVNSLAAGVGEGSVKKTIGDTLVAAGVLHYAAESNTWTFNESYFRVNVFGSRVVQNGCFQLDWVKIQQGVSSIDPIAWDEKRKAQYQDALKPILKLIANRGPSAPTETANLEVEAEPSALAQVSDRQLLEAIYAGQQVILDRLASQEQRIQALFDFFTAPATNPDS